jgi:hypothetical protein
MPRGATAHRQECLCHLRPNRPRMGRGDREVARVSGVPRRIGAPPTPDRSSSVPYVEEVLTNEPSHVSWNLPKEFRRS